MGVAFAQPSEPREPNSLDLTVSVMEMSPNIA
jgi:hypothetical protein